MNTKIKYVIAIQNNGSSGSTLLHSLLDGHPRILSLPMLWGNEFYAVWKNLKIIDLENLKICIKNNFQYFFDKSHSSDGLNDLGENQDLSVCVSEKEFFKYFDEFFLYNEISRKNFIISIYHVFNKIYNSDLDLQQKDIICFPIHSQNKETANMLLKDFNKIQFIYTVRDPIKNIGSIIKHLKNNFENLPYLNIKNLAFCAVEQVLNNQIHHFSYEKYFTYGTKYYFKDDKNISNFFVKLEDLHLGEKYMRTFCSKIGLEWSDNLLKSTFMNLKWHNRKESIRVSGFSKKIINQKYNEQLSELDVLRISQISKNFCKKFSYPQYKYKINFFYFIFCIWKKFKCENDIIIADLSNNFFDNLSQKNKIEKIKIFFSIKFQNSFIFRNIIIKILENKNLDELSKILKFLQKYHKLKQFILFRYFLLNAYIRNALTK